MCLSQNTSPLYFLKYEDLSVLIKCNRLHKYIPARLVNGLWHESCSYISSFLPVLSTSSISLLFRCLFQAAESLLKASTSLSVHMLNVLSHNSDTVSLLWMFSKALRKQAHSHTSHSFYWVYSLEFYPALDEVTCLHCQQCLHTSDGAVAPHMSGLCHLSLNKWPCYSETLPQVSKQWGWNDIQIRNKTTSHISVQFVSRTLNLFKINLLIIFV